MIRIATPITGPQLYVLGRRLHHFVIGVLAVGVGALLCWHDRADRRVCWRDLRTRIR